MGYGLRIAVVGLLLAAGACSSTDDTDKPTPSTSATSPANKQAVAAETIQACRALADDRELADYWRQVAAGRADARSAVGAANAIRQLEVYLPMPEVDRTVVASIQSATDAIAADGALTARPDEFRTIVTPIVQACEDLDIDMAVE